MKTVNLIDLSDRINMFYWQTNRKISAKEMKRIFLDRRNTVSIEDTKAAIEYGMVKSGKSKSDSRVIELGDPIPRGSVNNVLKATLADNTRIVVRMHPYHVQNGYFWVENIATSEAKKMGVPTFSTYFVDDTKDKFDFDYMIMEALPGKTLQDFWPLDSKLDEKLMKQTGKFVAKIHKVEVSGFGFFDNTNAKINKKLVGQYNSLKDHFYAGIQEDFEFLVNHKVITPKEVVAIRDVFSAKEILLTSNKRSCLIHNDIADWNELSDGKNITGIIDWDECFGGDPVMDFAQWSLFFDDKRLEYFKRGYETVTKLPENYQEKLHLFRLRYLVSKLHLRKKRALVLEDSSFINGLIKRGLDVMKQEFEYFGL